MGGRVLVHQGQFVLGLYRPQMKAIGNRDRIETIFGVPATTRNWNTIQVVARVLNAAPNPIV